MCDLGHGDDLDHGRRGDRWPSCARRPSRIAGCCPRPLAIFAGWLSAASAVSTGVLIAGYGCAERTPVAALAMLALVLVIALVVQCAGKPRMPVYGLTVIWALVGVIVVNAGRQPDASGGCGRIVMLAALA